MLYDANDMEADKYFFLFANLTWKRDLVGVLSDRCRDFQRSSSDLTPGYGLWIHMTFELLWHWCEISHSVYSSCFFDIASNLYLRIPFVFYVYD